MSVLDQLPEDYVLKRDVPSALPWGVYEYGEGGDWEDQYNSLGWVADGATPEAAVVAALEKLTGKCSDWTPRKKATGAMAFIPDLWSKGLLDSMEMQSVIAKRCREPFPYATRAAGATITIPRVGPLKAQSD